MEHYYRVHLRNLLQTTFCQNTQSVTDSDQQSDKPSATFDKFRAWMYRREQKREQSQRWGWRKVVFGTHVHGRN